MALLGHSELSMQEAKVIRIAWEILGKDIFNKCPVIAWIVKQCLKYVDGVINTGDDSFNKCREISWNFKQCLNMLVGWFISHTIHENTS